VLSSGPETTLAGFAVARGYDVVVLGALTHRRTLTSLVGTLTRKLLDALDCDLVLVRAASTVEPELTSIDPRTSALTSLTLL